VYGLKADPAAAEAALQPTHHRFQLRAPRGALAAASISYVGSNKRFAASRSERSSASSILIWRPTRQAFRRVRQSCPQVPARRKTQWRVATYLLHTMQTEVVKWGRSSPKSTSRPQPQSPREVGTILLGMMAFCRCCASIARGGTKGWERSFFVAPRFAYRSSLRAGSLCSRLASPRFSFSGHWGSS
jgi:hypothetical protein